MPTSPVPFYNTAGRALLARGIDSPESYSVSPVPCANCAVPSHELADSPAWPGELVCLACRDVLASTCSHCGECVPIVVMVTETEGACRACCEREPWPKVAHLTVIVVVAALRVGPSVRKAVAAYSETVVEARTIVRSA